MAYFFPRAFDNIQLWPILAGSILAVQVSRIDKLSTLLHFAFNLNDFAC